MVRVGFLYDQMRVSKKIRENKTNMSSEEQLTAIFKQVRKMTKEKDQVYSRLQKQFMKQGIEIVKCSALTEKEMDYLTQYFHTEIRPLLSPQVVGKKQPFPFLKSKEIYAVVVLEKKERKKIGIVPCSNGVFDRMVALPNCSNRYALVEDLILNFMPTIFENYCILGKSLIRIIRNADIEMDEELEQDDMDYRELMEKMIRKRKKLSPVKLEYSSEMNEKVLEVLCKYLHIKKKQAFFSDTPLDFSFFKEIRDRMRTRQELFYPKQLPSFPVWYQKGKSVMEQIEQEDRLLAFPYESMRPFLQLLHEAALAPDVVSIKMMLYRVANHSKVVEELICAAENGKEVVVILELRARFDEKNNIECSRQLEAAGCRIIYGIDGLKVHAKLCLITRKRENKISYLTQVGTGNYNETTSMQYTDLLLMTAHQGIGEETGRLFTALCTGQVLEETKHLLVAPKCLQNQILDKIDFQIEEAKKGKDAYIGAKINSLTDKRIIKKLIEASQAGVKIELIVRGICCVIAGMERYTENITVRSIVGRYLEHSRIYIFGQDDVYIASADYMTRNTLHRVEVAAPVYDDKVRKRVLKMFRVMMQDTVKARNQLPDGCYQKVKKTKHPINAQEACYYLE
jgi:polyphosphate kinase